MHKRVTNIDAHIGLRAVEKFIIAANVGAPKSTRCCVGPKEAKGIGVRIGLRIANMGGNRIDVQSNLGVGNDGCKNQNKT